MEKPTIRYSGFCHEITTRFRLEDMAPMDRGNLLWDLLIALDPGMGHEDYEKFQIAADVVLKRTNEMWA